MHRLSKFKHVLPVVVAVATPSLLYAFKGSTANMLRSTVDGLEVDKRTDLPRLRFQENAKGIYLIPFYKDDKDNTYVLLRYGIDGFNLLNGYTHAQCLELAEKSGLGVENVRIYSVPLTKGALTIESCIFEHGENKPVVTPESGFEVKWINVKDIAPAVDPSHYWIDCSFGQYGFGVKLGKGDGPILLHALTIQTEKEKNKPTVDKVEQQEYRSPQRYGRE